MKHKIYSNNILHLIYPSKERLQSDYLKLEGCLPKKEKVTYPNPSVSTLGFGILMEFLNLPELEKNPLSIRDLIKRVSSKKPTLKFLISTYESGPLRILYHELSHAFFNLIPSYQEEAIKIVNKIPREIRGSLERNLSSKTYLSEDLPEELQAHLVSELSSFKEEGIDISSLHGFSQQLNELFNKYCPREFLNI